MGEQYRPLHTRDTRAAAANPTTALIVWERPRYSVLAFHYLLHNTRRAAEEAFAPLVGTLHDMAERIARIAEG